MKAATGELNLTVITIIAIGAVIAFFWFMWPSIRDTIEGQWGTISDNNCIEYDTDGNCVRHAGD